MLSFICANRTCLFSNASNIFSCIPHHFRLTSVTFEYVPYDTH